MEVGLRMGVGFEELGILGVGLKNVLGVGFEQLNIWFSIIVSQRGINEPPPPPRGPHP